MRRVKLISPYQFAVFRIALGLYLVQHFLFLIWGPAVLGAVVYPCHSVWGRRARPTE